jgi:hypothetical protein
METDKRDIRQVAKEEPQLLTHDEFNQLKGIMIAFIVILTVGLAVGGYTIVTWIDRVEKLEAKDTASLRTAAFRICARDQLDRAEIHAAYATPIIIPQSADPIVIQLLSSAEAQRKVSLRRVRANLPILDCKPNLEGNPADPLGPKGQRSFVAKYLQGLLDPTPGDDQLDPEARRRDDRIERQLDRLSDPPPRKLASPRAQVAPDPTQGRPQPGTGQPQRPREAPRGNGDGGGGDGGGDGNGGGGGDPSPTPTTPTTPPTPTTPELPPVPVPETPDPGQGLLPDVIEGVCNNLPLPIICTGGG